MSINREKLGLGMMLTSIVGIVVVVSCQTWGIKDGLLIGAASLFFCIGLFMMLES